MSCNLMENYVSGPLWRTWRDIDGDADVLKKHKRLYFSHFYWIQQIIIVSAGCEK